MFYVPSFPEAHAKVINPTNSLAERIKHLDYLFEHLKFPLHESNIYNLLANIALSDTDLAAETAFRLAFHYRHSDSKRHLQVSQDYWHERALKLSHPEAIRIELCALVFGPNPFNTTEDVNGVAELKRFLYARSLRAKLMASGNEQAIESWKTEASKQSDFPHDEFLDLNVEPTQLLQDYEYVDRNFDPVVKFLEAYKKFLKLQKDVDNPQSKERSKAAFALSRLYVDILGYESEWIHYHNLALELKHPKAIVQEIIYMLESRRNHTGESLIANVLNIRELMNSLTKAETEKVRQKVEEIDSKYPLLEILFSNESSVVFEKISECLIILSNDLLTLEFLKESESAESALKTFNTLLADAQLCIEHLNQLNPEVVEAVAESKPNDPLRNLLTHEQIQERLRAVVEIKFLLQQKALDALGIDYKKALITFSRTSAQKAPTAISDLREIFDGYKFETQEKLNSALRQAHSAVSTALSRKIVRNSVVTEIYKRIQSLSAIAIPNQVQGTGLDAAIMEKKSASAFGGL